MRCEALIAAERQIAKGKMIHGGEGRSSLASRGVSSTVSAKGRPLWRLAECSKGLSGSGAMLRLREE